MVGISGSWIESRLGGMRLGEILVDHKVINNAQLTCTLHIAQEQGKRIGEALVDLGLASVTDVQTALEEQRRMEVS